MNVLTSRTFSWYTASPEVAVGVRSKRRRWLPVVKPVFFTLKSFLTDIVVYFSVFHLKYTFLREINTGEERCGINRLI